MTDTTTDYLALAAVICIGTAVVGWCIDWLDHKLNPTKNDPAETRSSSTRKGEQVTR